MYYNSNRYMNPFLHFPNYGRGYTYSANHNHRLHKNQNKQITNHSAANNTYKTSFSKEEAAAIALLLGIDFKKSMFDLNEFWTGVNVELEHGRRSSHTNVTGDDPILTGKIALAHLNEFPDYYKRLTQLEEEAKAYWSKRSFSY